MLSCKVVTKYLALETTNKSTLEIEQVKKPTIINLSREKKAPRIRKPISMEKNHGIIVIQRSPEQTLLPNTT